MAEIERAEDFRARVLHYARILNDLFDATQFMRGDRLFEFVCTLVRCGGLQGPGWDPWEESRAFLDDLASFAALELPPDKFTDPERTQVRLALISYCHLTEMDLFYFLIANLLRLRLGEKYDVTPFRDLYKQRRPKKRSGPLPTMIAPSPHAKVGRILQLSQSAGLPGIGESLAQIYDRTIRNAVFHSDYVLYEKRMHLFENRLSRATLQYSQIVTFEELSDLVRDAFAFYTALLSLYERCRGSFGDFRNALIPYDLRYKGLMELLFDNGALLTGFRIYWPNASFSQYSRSREGTICQNIVFDPDGSINFMVGIYASRPGSWSPLVEQGGQPQYPQRPGSNVQPYWPDKICVYKLPPE